jgi:transposase-like protein
MKLEREAVRQRRAERLSKKNRALISEVDLKEPQMRDEQQPLTVSQAVMEVLPAHRNGSHAGVTVQEILLAAAPMPAVDTAEEFNPFIDKPMPHVRSGRGGKPPITPVQRKEIADAYAAGMSVTEICRAYEIGVGALYQTIDAFGLARRGRPGGSAHSTRRPREEPVTHVVVTSSPPVVVTSSPPESPQLAAAASANGTNSDLPQWVVTYQVVRTETVTVAARDFSNAAAAAINSIEEGAEVLSVARKRRLPE